MILTMDFQILAIFYASILMCKSTAGKFKIVVYIILNFPTLFDFLIRKLKKEQEFQNYFCRSLLYLSIS